MCFVMQTIVFSFWGGGGGEGRRGGGGVLANTRIELTTVHHWGGEMGMLKNLASATKKQKFNVCLFVF